MGKIDNRFLNMKEIQELLEITEEEQKSLNSYQGTSTEVNELLGVYITDTPVLSKDKDYYFTQDGNPKDRLDRYMKMIIDIYSALIKNAYADRYQMSIKKHRGSAHSLLNRKYHSFISTSGNFDEAALFAVSNNRDKPRHIISNLHIAGDVPVYYMEQKGNEAEVLVSPFVEITKDDSGYYGATYSTEVFGKRVSIENLNVKRRELAKLSKEEQEKLYEELMATSQEMLKMISVYYDSKNDYRLASEELSKKQQDKIKVINEDMQLIAEARRSGNYERENKYLLEKQRDVEYFNRVLSELEQKVDKIYEKKEEAEHFVLGWREKFRTLAEARCADKEVELDQQIQAIINPILQKEEEQRKQQEERKRIEQERSKVQLETGTQNAVVLSNTINNSIDRVCRSADYNKLMMHRDRYKRAGIQMSTQIDALKFAIDGIGNLSQIDFLSEDCEQMMKQKNQRGISFSDSLANLSEAVKNNANSIAAQTDNEFKCAMMSRVLSVRGVQEYRLLEGNQRQIENQKIGIFGRNKKEQEKQHSLEMISAKKNEVNTFISNIQKYGLDTTKEYSARDIMAEIITAEKGPLTEQEKRNLQEVRYLLNAVFDINQPGIDKRVAENDMLYGNPNRATEFLKKFDIEKGYINRRMTPTPVHPLVKFAKDMQITISNVKNRSDREHAELLRKSRETNLPFKPMDEMEH